MHLELREVAERGEHRDRDELAIAELEPGAGVHVTERVLDDVAAQVAEVIDDRLAGGGVQPGEVGAAAGVAVAGLQVVALSGHGGHATRSGRAAVAQVGGATRLARRPKRRRTSQPRGHGARAVACVASGGRCARRRTPAPPASIFTTRRSPGVCTMPSTSCAATIPVHPIGDGRWLLTRYDDVVEILKDRERCGTDIHAFAATTRSGRSAPAATSNGCRRGS